MKRILRFNLWLLAGLILLGACQTAGSETPLEQGTVVALQLESNAFAPGETIPQRYTCDGEDLSPSLSWSEPLSETQSLVILCDDPDAPAGTWNHWVFFNVLPTIRSLPEGVPPDQVVEGVGAQGSNSWQRVGYGGPCPPSGSVHRYVFKIYALDATLDLNAGASVKDVKKAMAGHVLVEGQLAGQYGR
jgi:Raf kinase inhibitor-like YbhB/YbcL family protein